MKLLAACSVGAFCALLSSFGVGGRTQRRAWRGARRVVGAQQVWLTQAGVRLTPRQFWTGSLAAGAVAFVVLWGVTRTVLVAVVPSLVVAWLPRAYFARARAERMRQVQVAWPDGLRDIVASIASGRSLTQALVVLAESGPPAVREAFARFPRLSRMFGTVVALDVVKEELADPTSDRVIEVLILAHERGGPIVKEILEDLIVTTTKDVKLRDEIETEGLEMKINARAVLVLPWCVLVALVARAGPFRDFYRSGAGVLVVAVGAGLSALGSLWVTRLGRSQDEQRVFGASGLTTGGTAP